MIFNANPTILNSYLQPLLTGLHALLPDTNRVYGRLPVEAVSDLDQKAQKMPLFFDGSNHLRILPDEAAGPLAFFIATGPAIYNPESRPYETGVNIVTQPLALILWGKRDDLNTSADTLFARIVGVLSTDPGWRTSRFADELQASVFAGLDYDFENHRYLMHPFFGARIEGEFTYGQFVADCI